MYLSARESIVLNYNPFIAFVPHLKPDLMTQSIRATNFLISSLRMLNSLRAKNLEPEIYHMNPDKSDTLLFKRLMRLLPESVSFYGAYMFNAYPLDMSQYYRLFNSTRIPKKGKDLLFTDASKKHILVLRKGHYFVFPVFDKHGDILPPNTIYSYIDHICKMNLNDAEYPIGVLTSENRDTWASIREKLEQTGNKDILEAIDSSIYCLSLDDTCTDDPDKLSHQFLYGNPQNRWFDKSLTLIVNQDAQSAVNFEHSWGDGVAVLRFFTEVFKDVQQTPFITRDSKPDSNSNPQEYVKKLEFKLNDDVKQAISEAKQKYDSATSKLKMKNFDSNKFGKDFIKKYKLSPDSVMQTIFQSAFFKLYNQTVATYESCSTAAFKYGRTETIRPASIHTKRFSQLFNSSKASPSELYDILRDCSKYHNQLTKEAAMGQGFDRHLFAMRYYAQKSGKRLPDFYLDPSYKLINHNILSTSTLAHPTVLTGGFAPVVDDGFGVGYRILDKSYGACISAYGSRDLDGFVEALKESFNKLEETLKKIKKKDD